MQRECVAGAALRPQGELLGPCRGQRRWSSPGRLPGQWRTRRRQPERGARWKPWRWPSGRCRRPSRRTSPTGSSWAWSCSSGPRPSPPASRGRGPCTGGQPTGVDQPDPSMTSSQSAQDPSSLRCGERDAALQAVGFCGRAAAADTANFGHREGHSLAGCKQHFSRLRTHAPSPRRTGRHQCIRLGCNSTSLVSQPQRTGKGRAQRFCRCQRKWFA